MKSKSKQDTGGSKGREVETGQEKKREGEEERGEVYSLNLWQDIVIIVLFLLFIVNLLLHLTFKLNFIIGVYMEVNNRQGLVLFHFRAPMGFWNVSLADKGWLQECFLILKLFTAKDHFFKNFWSFDAECCVILMQVSKGILLITKPYILVPNKMCSLVLCFMTCQSPTAVPICKLWLSCSHLLRADYSFWTSTNQLRTLRTRLM